MTAIPDGFALHERRSPVTDPWAPLYARTSTGVVELGLPIAEAHCNSRGFLHGGVAAALADNAMGLSYGLALKGDLGGGIVTVSLALDYAGSGRIGQWLQITPRIIKAGRGLGFIDALVTADGDAIARASATFRRLDAPGAAS